MDARKTDQETILLVVVGYRQTVFVNIQSNKQDKAREQIVWDFKKGTN